MSQPAARSPLTLRPSSRLPAMRRRLMPPSAPVGDPHAHASSLLEVKRELKILNLCGGATSTAFADPIVKSTRPGFTADPRTSQSEGQLPVLTGRLDATRTTQRPTTFS